MSDDKNQGGPSDFEDDFDDLEFEDIDFDETDMDTAGYEDLTDEDLQDDDFSGDDDWEEEDVAAAPARRWGKKDKGFYTDTSERKGLSLSFNTMVILGAMLLGGSVLAYTVMSKTSQVNANKPSVFQSMLGIGSVFDGQIFGDGAKEGFPTQASEDGNITALDQSAGQAGLLDNPDQALSALDGAPPSPSPIAPTEEDDIITPLPGDHVPRGPEEYAASPDMQLEPIPPAAPQSADDILKAAIANRAGKDKEQAEAPIEITSEPAPVEAAPIVPESEIVIAEETPKALDPQPFPLPPIEKPSAEEIAKLQEAQKRAVAAEEQIQSLQKQLADLQSRLGETENALTSARSGQNGATADLQKTVDALKADLKSANDKANAEAKARQDAELKAAQARKDAEAAQKEAAAKAAEVKKQADAALAAKKAAQEKEAAAKKTASVATTPKAPSAPKAAAKQQATAPVRDAYSAQTQTQAAASVRWELRAAQPGRAWVSKLGARDMQSVSVGDTLPGIGRITAISYLGGRWVVQGTTGQIYQ